MSDPNLAAVAARLNARAADAGLMMATAESCTGGLVAAMLTEAAGASSVFERGFVTYSNDAKAQMLGVPMALIDEHGAVSGPVAQAMADGAVAHSNADLAVSITGIAGPGGGSADKPVGLVWFGLSRHGRATRIVERRFGDVGRARVRELSVLTALELLSSAI